MNKHFFHLQKFKISIALIFNLCSSSLLYGQNNNKGIVEKINITDWIQPQKEIDLKNKCVVLEFWATWCAPCLSAIPHMNTLQSHYTQNDKLVFLSISNEKADKIKSILPRFHFSSTVVIDTTGKTQKAYNVQSLPVTILLDSNQNIKWIGQPLDLTTDKINSLLKGVPIINNNFAERADSLKLDSVYQEYRTAFDYSDLSSFFKVTQPSLLYSGKSTSKIGVTKYNTVQIGVKISTLFSNLLHVSESELSIPDNLKDKAISFCFKNSSIKSVEEGEKKLLEAITNSLNLKLKDKLSFQNVYELKISNSKKLDKNRISSNKELNSRGFSISDDNKVIAIYNSSLDVLEKCLTTILNTSVKLKTKLNTTDKYDITLNNSSSQDLERSMRYYGLMLDKRKKNIKKYYFNY